MIVGLRCQKLAGNKDVGKIVNDQKLITAEVLILAKTVDRLGFISANKNYSYFKPKF